MPERNCSQDLEQRGVSESIFHAAMEPSEKAKLLASWGPTPALIATTAFITGLNAVQLRCSVIWQFAYTFESITQFMGRLARERGAGGRCTFITYPEAIIQWLPEQHELNEEHQLPRIANQVPTSVAAYETVCMVGVHQLPPARLPMHTCLHVCRVLMKRWTEWFWQVQWPTCDQA